MEILRLFFYFITSYNKTDCQLLVLPILNVKQIMFNTFMYKLVTWFDSHVVQGTKNQRIKVMLKFQYNNGIITLEFNYFGNYLFSTFCSL